MQMYKNRPGEPGLYWVIANKKLYTGYIKTVSNGVIGIIDGCFDFDMDDVYWGDRIDIPEDLMPFNKIWEWTK